MNNFLENFKYYEDVIKKENIEMWTPEPHQIITAEQKAQEFSISERKRLLPNLYPDQFWFGLRAGGYDDDVRNWISNLNDPGTEDNPNPSYDPIAWAWASSKLEYASFFERDHDLVYAFCEAVGISDIELDALWAFAATG